MNKVPTPSGKGQWQHLQVAKVYRRLDAAWWVLSEFGLWLTRERDTVHEQGIIITNPLSTITILISIMQSSLLKHPYSGKWALLKEIKVFEKKFGKLGADQGSKYSHNFLSKQ